MENKSNGDEHEHSNGHSKKVFKNKRINQSDNFI